MAWLEHAMNPIAMSALYKEVPLLSDVELFDIVLSREGPTMTCSIGLPKFLDIPPEKWRKSGYNACNVKLQFISFTELRIEGWSSNPIVDLKVNKLQSSLDVSLVGASTKIRMTCVGFRIDKISPYVDGRRLGEK